MKYYYWVGINNRARAKEELYQYVLKNDRDKRKFEKEERHFGKYPLSQLMDAQKVASLKKYNHYNLHEWRIRLPQTTARMFFILKDEHAFFIYCSVKKSKNGISTPQNIIEKARVRAQEFWSYES